MSAASVSTIRGDGKAKNPDSAYLLSVGDRLEAMVRAMKALDSKQSLTRPISVSSPRASLRVGIEGNMALTVRPGFYLGGIKGVRPGIAPKSSFSLSPQPKAGGPY